MDEALRSAGQSVAVLADLADCQTADVAIRIDMLLAQDTSPCDSI
jgi:hypothetical protein